MFKGFQKEAINSRSRDRKATIEDKRQIVINGIDAWLWAVAGMPLKGAHSLSKIDGDRRLVWLKYSKQNVPLTAAGDLVGEIDPAQDEAAFWHWMRGQVQAGVYDPGIERVSAAVYRRLQGKP